MQQGAQAAITGGSTIEVTVVISIIVMICVVITLILTSTKSAKKSGERMGKMETVVEGLAKISDRQTASDEERQKLIANQQALLADHSRHFLQHDEQMQALCKTQGDHGEKIAEIAGEQRLIREKLIVVPAASMRPRNSGS